MPKYINADNFAKQVYEVAYPIIHDNNSHERGLTLMGIAQLLDEQPTADVRENISGEWIEKSEIGDCCYICSKCGFVRDAYILDIGNYCPNCGADMR